MLVLLLAIACSTHTEPTPTSEPTEQVVPAAPTERDEPEPVKAVEDDCLERCKRDNMARPVAPEIIERDCAKSCAMETAIQSKADLAGKTGKNVLAIGTYVRTLHHGAPEPFMGTGLKLDDGTMLWLTTGTTEAAGFEGRFDQRMTVGGTLAAGEAWDPDLWLKDAKFEGQSL